jgi:hypothetical protein
MLRTDRGRTYDRSRPNRSKRQKSACHGGPSYDDLRADLDELLLQTRQRLILDREALTPISLQESPSRRAPQLFSAGHTPRATTTGAAQNAYLTLISAIGISPLTQIKVADVSDRKLSPEMEVSVERVISTALARRPDILAAYAAQKASLAGVRAAEAEFLPKVFLSGTGSYNGGTLSVAGIPSIGNLSSVLNLSGNHFGGIVFGGVTVPVFDGGTRAAILEQAKAKSDNAGLALSRRVMRLFARLRWPIMLCTPASLPIRLLQPSLPPPRRHLTLR